MRQYLPFSKVEEHDDGTMTVTGVASSESTDSAGEIIRADAIRAALPDFFRHGSGPLREMHQLSAAGTVDVADIDGTNKTYITATVVDPLAQKKILTKTYKGFSVGGRVTERDSTNRKIITGLQLAEISLVDRPCNPDSVFDMLKADGVDLDDDLPVEEGDAVDETALDAQIDDEKTAAAKVESTEEGQETIVEPEDSDPVVDADTVEKRKFDTAERKKDAKSGSAMPDGSFPIVNKQDLRNAIQAYGRAKNKAAAKRHIIARAKALGAADLIPDEWKDTKKVHVADAETGDPLAKAGATADPINPSTVGDVMADGAGNADSQTPGAPVAGAKVIANFPPGDSRGADTTNVANPATAGNDGQDKLTTSDTAVVEHRTAATPTDGVDVRTHKHPAGKAEVVDPISAARDAAEQALKSAVASTEKVAAAVGGSSIPAPLRAGAELRKSLGTVARLGYLLSELAYILSDVRYEAEYEADDSPVPDQLRAAIAPLAAVYRAMSEEELSELMSQVDAKTASAMAAAVSGGDALKAFAAIADPDSIAKLSPLDEQLAKRDTEISGLKDNVETLLKINGDLTKGLEHVTKRMDELAAMPMPPKTLTASAPVETVVKAVTKEEDTAGITKVEAAHAAPVLSMSPEDFQKAWDSLPADQRAELSLRASLQRPIPINR